MVIIIFALLMSACGRSKVEQVETPPLVEAEDDKTTPEVTDPVVAPVTDPVDEGDVVITPPIETAPPQGGNGPEKTQPEDTKPFWQSETTRQMNNLTAIANAGQMDYKVNGAKRGWFSKNGKLYSQYEARYITTDVLVEDGYLETGLTAGDYEILLINGSDLAEVEGASVPKESMDFTVFAATKQSGKYLLASSAGKAGQISESVYQQLLDRYSQSHGQIVRLSSTSAEYSRILNYISLFEGRFDDYFVREIRRDDKYAVAVFSSRTDVANIKEYILQNDNNFWEVVVPNAQTEYYPLTAINRYVPDFNVELLPVYNLASWRGSITKEQSGAVAALFSNHFIESASEITYQCSTASCSYVMLSNAKRYVCYKEGGVWKAEFVDSDLSAKKLFIAKTGTDYGFLILDD